MNAYETQIWNRIAVMMFLACLLLTAGCGGSRLTNDQAGIFADRVAPELKRILHALDATNASPVGIGGPFRPDEVLCTYVSMDGSIWVVHRDMFRFTLESRPSASVSLLSMVADEPRIQQAVAKLQERLSPAGQITPLTHLRFAIQLGSVEDLNSRITNPTNEYRISANQIQHIAQVLGYRSVQGGIIPGINLGVALHHIVRPPATSPADQQIAQERGPPLSYNVWTEENSGGYVGLYSASTNLNSVDLVVFLYRGKVQAILQRSEAARQRPLQNAADISR